MAHQTSKISQKQSTPHSIGRLMDAQTESDFLEIPELTGRRPPQRSVRQTAATDGSSSDFGTVN
jgi:hypothetical protein